MNQIMRNLKHYTADQSAIAILDGLTECVMHAFQIEPEKNDWIEQGERFEGYVTNQQFIRRRVEARLIEYQCRESTRLFYTLITDFEMQAKNMGVSK